MDVDIIEVMSRGKNQTTEFLPSDASPLSIAKAISAFANTDGGTILFGVLDDSSICGVEPNVAKSTIEKALEMLSISSVARFDIKQTRVVLNVAVIKVEKSEQIVFCDSGAYIRSGENIRVMPQEEIRLLVGSSSSSINALSVVLEKQTLMIETLEKSVSHLKGEITKENSITSKIKNHLAGALLGGLVGVFFGAIGFK